MPAARVPIAHNLGVDKDVMGDLVLKNWNKVPDLFLDFSVVGVITSAYMDRGANDKLWAAKARVKIE